MSYYYNYYIGYEKDGKFYPLGPYDDRGKLKSALSISRSFASDLHDDFLWVKEEQISDELRKEFEYESFDGERTMNLKYLGFQNLPCGSFIKKGYFLIEDIKCYEARKEVSVWDIFYDYLSPEVYVAKAQNEAKFGPPKKKYDEFGDDITEHSAADYMFYAYPDYESKEYEAHILMTFVDSLFSYSRFKLESQIVILETEG